MRIAIYYLLTLLELPFMILAGIDYLLNLICKHLSKGCLLFIIPSLLFTPITFIYHFCCSTIIMLKNRVIRNDITFSQAMQIFENRLPYL